MTDQLMHCIVTAGPAANAKAHDNTMPRTRDPPKNMPTPPQHHKWISA